MERRISSARRFILAAVLDGAALGPDPRSFAARLFEAGLDWIQLRDRTLDSDPLYALARQLVSAARDVSNARHDAAEDQGDAIRDVPEVDTPPIDFGGRWGIQPRVLINRRVDIALASGADGVHLGFDAVDPGSARALLGKDALIGASFHTPDEVLGAQGTRDAPALLSYVHLAPIWNPISKPASRPPLGELQLSEAARADLPILAQGGLDEERAGKALIAGAAGIAVTGLLTRAGDSFAATRNLRRALDAIRIPPGQRDRNQNRRAGDTETAQ